MMAFYNACDFIMANFNTHLKAGALVATTMAGIGWHLGLGFGSLGGILLLGVLGGILPDIDLPHSKSIGASAVLLGVFIGAVYQHHGASVADVFICTSIAICVFWSLLAVLARFCRHRGMMHSIPMLGICALVIVYALQDLKTAHILGGALFIGGMVHLMLDEMYSIDVRARRLKRSFGTALKLFERRHPRRYLTLYLVLAALILMAKSP